MKLEHIYRGWAPVSIRRMDERYGYTFNQLSYAILDVRLDIARLDKEFGQGLTA